MITELISLISEFALEVIRRSGYWGVFFLSMLESAAIPIPSEVVVPFAGFLASTGEFTLLNVVLVSTFANLAGAIVLYWVGKSGGRWVLERYGKYVLITHREMQTGDEWFAKHGLKIIFWGRMLPVVRTFISLPAGVSKMPFWEFSLFTLLGSLPWNFALAYAGFKIGENWEIVHNNLGWLSYVILALIIVFGVWFIWRHRKNAK